MKKHAFTLIELLVVISIIALLIAILLPVLSKARTTVMERQCAINVRSFTQAMFAYQADNGTAPRAAESFNGSNSRLSGYIWYDTLMGTGEGNSSSDGYMGTDVNIEVQRCPIVYRDTVSQVTASGMSEDGTNSVYTYKYSPQIGGVTEAMKNGSSSMELEPYSFDQVRKPSDTVAIAEALVPKAYDLSAPSAITGWQRAQWSIFRFADEAAVAHSQGTTGTTITDTFGGATVTLSGRRGNSNMAFADGSVRTEQGTQSSRWLSRNQTDPDNSFDRGYEDPEDLIWGAFYDW